VSVDASGFCEWVVGLCVRVCVYGGICVCPLDIVLLSCFSVKLMNYYMARIG